jgi:hypothetical protein
VDGCCYHTSRIQPAKPVVLAKWVITSESGRYVVAAYAYQTAGYVAGLGAGAVNRDDRLLSRLIDPG